MGTQSITPTSRRTRIPLWIAFALLLALYPLIATAQSAVSATTIPLLLPSAIVFDTQGNLYIAETANHVIRKVDTSGIITIAGTGTQGFAGDNGPAAAAALDSPQGLALDANQNIYIADTHNHRIRKLSLTTGIIATIAGTTSAGFAGDNGPATAAQLNLPTTIALDAANNLYIADTGNHRIRKLTATTGIITTIAGTGTQGFSGDNGPATAAAIDSPTSIALDTAGNLYLADTHNHRIRKITPANNQITTIAGTGVASFGGDNSAANAAPLARPHGLTIDATGNLYLADTGNHRIRRIDAATGIITTIAGDGTQSFAGDNAPATAASLDSPRATALPPSSLLTLADTGNQRIRQLTPQLRTIAGLGATIPGTLALTAPSVITYGTGQIIASLATTTTATGPITFLDLANGVTTTLDSTPLSANIATVATTSLSAGIHGITATYAGDATHASAQSPIFALNVVPQQLTASANPVTVVYGQSIPQITGTLTGLLSQDSTRLSTIFTTSAANLSPAGTYPIAATISGPAAGNYSLTTAPATLTITQAPVRIALAASAATAVPGLPLTFTANIASITTGTPTGTAVFLDNAIPIFTTNLSATGQAAFTTNTLAAGSHTLTVSYSGDRNFIPITSDPSVVGVGTVSGSTPGSDFTLAATGTSTQTIVTGNTASFAFTVQLQGDPLSSPIALAATGLPNLATACFNPAYLPPGAATNTFTLTIKTPNTIALSRAPNPITLAFLLLPITGLTLRLRNHRKTATLLAFTILTAALTLCSGCGDRINTASLSTPLTRPYTITVTGTATTPTGSILQHAANVTLLVPQAN